ncbi:MAG: hypothetical protein ACPHCN_12960 [Mycobacterium sp.]
MSQKCENSHALIRTTAADMLSQIRKYLNQADDGHHIRGLLEDGLYRYEMKVRDDESGCFVPMVTTALIAGAMGLIIGAYLA